MKLPDEVKSIRDRYVAKFPVPQGAPSEEFEESARWWTIGLVEQVAFELPGHGWGVKRADPNRPISKDTISQDLGGGRIRIWDLMTGTGTGRPRLAADPDSEDVAGQFFETRPEFFSPKDRLGSAPPKPADPGPTQPPPPAVDAAALAAAVASALDARLGGIEGRLAALEAKEPPKFPEPLPAPRELKRVVGEYTFLGRTVTLSLKAEY